MTVAAETCTMSVAPSLQSVEELDIFLLAKFIKHKIKKKPTISIFCQTSVVAYVLLWFLFVLSYDRVFNSLTVCTAFWGLF